jgi:hypothetical protein
MRSQDARGGKIDRMKAAENGKLETLLCKIIRIDIQFQADSYHFWSLGCYLNSVGWDFGKAGQILTQPLSLPKNPSG